MRRKPMDAAQRADDRIEWCVVRLDSDFSWWVAEANWLHEAAEEEKLSILDPRQVEYVYDLLEPLREYGLRSDVVEQAFINFAIEKDLGGGRVRLIASEENIRDSGEKLFAMPNVFSESYGGYAEFLDHVSALRIKYLNARKRFSQQLTVDELEDEVRESLENQHGDGASPHLFLEIAGVLEYCPAGFSDDEEELEEETGDDWDQ